MEIYTYIVKYYDEIRDDWKKESGIVCGESIHDAVEKIEDFYSGIDNLSVFTLEGTESGIVIMDDLLDLVNANDLDQR